MNIYTIIVTYNAMRKGWIERCLKSLEASSIPTTTIVVDNMSTDGTREFVPANYPNIVWLPQDKNLGFGQANNLGIKYALAQEADYVMLLNQDAAVAPDAIEKMLSASDGESLLSPLHLNGDGSALDYMFRGTIRTMRQRTLLDDLLINKPLKPAYETGEVCAACWFMPKSLINNIGGFNPLFFHYSEDNNYYQRLVFHGIKIFIVPKAMMFHDRNIRGDQQAYNHNLVYRDLILEACNINQSFIKCCVKFVRILARCYVYDLRRKQYIPGNYTLSLLHLIAKTKDIMLSRKKERKQGITWLY
jgi:GT2 family glycosyltransferase